jgi:hypothetical protein
MSPPFCHECGTAYHTQPLRHSPGLCLFPVSPDLGYDTGAAYLLSCTCTFFCPVLLRNIHASFGAELLRAGPAPMNCAAAR